MGGVTVWPPSAKGTMDTCCIVPTDTVLVVSGGKGGGGNRVWCPRISTGSAVGMAFA